MAGYVKLDCGMLDSSVWFDPDQRNVFLTVLLMATLHEVRAPAPQLDIDSAEPTGWTVPPGWYGFVAASPLAIPARALVPADRTMAALRKMGEPEKASRSQKWEGRRVVRVNGGLIVLNYCDYREKDYTAAERMARWRERQKAKATPAPRAKRAKASGVRAMTAELDRRERAATVEPPDTEGDF